MSEKNDSSVVTRLLEHAQQRPIEASFGQLGTAAGTTGAPAPLQPLPRHRAPAGSVAPPLSALATTSTRLAPPALPPVRRAAKPVQDEAIELLADEDFDEEGAKTVELPQATLAVAATMPRAQAPAGTGPGLRAATQRDISVERGLQEMANHWPSAEDTNPGRLSHRRAAMSPLMEPSPSIVVAPALVVPAHSAPTLPAVLPARKANTVTAPALAPVAPLLEGGGVRMPTVRVRRIPWIAIGAAALVAGAAGALLAMQADKVAMPQPTATPVIGSPVAPAPTMVEVAINSAPAGAAVEIVEGNTVRSLGITPLVAKVVMAPSLPVTFRLDGYEPMAQVLQPEQQRELAVVMRALAAPVAPEAPAPVVPAPVVPAVADVMPTPADAAATTLAAAAVPVASKPAAKATRRGTTARAATRVGAQGAALVEAPLAPAAGRKGMLSLGAKPPCAIYVNGKNTGLMTPQRDLVLPAGKHKITLVNKEHGIREAFTVEVKAGSESRVVKDYSGKIKP